MYQCSKRENNSCQIPGCVGSSKDKFCTYKHFCRRHVEATIILKEDLKIDRCELCGMFRKNVVKKQNTKTCKDGQKRKKKIRYFRKNR